MARQGRAQPNRPIIVRGPAAPTPPPTPQIVAARTPVRRIRPATVVRSPAAPPSPPRPTIVGGTPRPQSRLGRLVTVRNPQAPSARPRPVVVARAIPRRPVPPPLVVRNSQPQIYVKAVQPVVNLADGVVSRLRRLGRALVGRNPQPPPAVLPSRDLRVSFGDLSTKWRVGDLNPKWRVGDLNLKWSFGLPLSVSIPAVSLEYLRIGPVTATDSGVAVVPTADAVNVAFLTTSGTNPTAGQWLPAAWETAGTTYWIRLLVGPGGAFVPVRGQTYFVWVDIVDVSEIPARQVGTLIST